MPGTALRGEGAARFGRFSSARQVAGRRFGGERLQIIQNKAMGLPVFADIGVAAAIFREVGHQTAYQHCRLVREAVFLGRVITATGVSEGQHPAILP
jgi:hypothetical protein